jgi:hypothetical protein
VLSLQESPSRNRVANMPTGQGGKLTQNSHCADVGLHGRRLFRTGSSATGAQSNGLVGLPSCDAPGVRCNAIPRAVAGGETGRTKRRIEYRAPDVPSAPPRSS